MKRFMDKKPDWRKIIRAIDAARFVPAAGNNYVLRFILVDDAQRIAKIAKATQQGFVGTAKYIVIAVSEDSKLVRLFGNRARRYAGQQAGAAIQNFLLALTDEGLVTSWVGHFSDELVAEAVGLDEGVTIEAIFPIGIETKIKTPQKPKPLLENILYFDKWKEKKMRPETRVSVEGV